MADQKDPAGSATGIDLAALEQLARAADPYGAAHIITHYRGNADLPAEEAYRRAANPAAVLELIALARATPQHPDDLSNAEFLSKRLARVAKLAGVTMPDHMTHEQVAEVAGTILGDIARHLEKAATPQHSLTDPASIGRDPEFNRLHGAWMQSFEYYSDDEHENVRRDWNALIAYIDSRAQPLPSTAATTQPEQALTAAVDAAMVEMANISPPLRRSECARLIRAALAIPASTATGELVHQLRSITGHGEWQRTDADGATCIKRMPHWADIYEFRTLQVVSGPAASEQQASVSEVSDKIVCPGCNGMATYIGQHDGYDDADCHMCDGSGKVAALSGRATIPSDADERELAVTKQCLFQAQQAATDLAQKLAHAESEMLALTHRATTATALPVEPTEAMLNAARDWSVKKYGIGIGNDAAIGCWQAMRAAAPDTATTAADRRCAECSQPLLRHEWNCSQHIDNRREAAAADQQGDTASATLQEQSATMLAQRKKIQQLEAAIAQQGAAQAQAGDDARDAARYRWLRDSCPDLEGMTSAWLYDTFDKAIDAAMAAPATSNGSEG